MILVVVAAIAFLTSAVAGMLGIGGAVLLIPAYLLIPPLLGLDQLTIREISGMTSVQIFVGSIFAFAVHRSKGMFDPKLFYTIGIPMMVASFAGAYASGRFSEQVIYGVFGAMAVTGAVLLGFKREAEEAHDFHLNVPLAIAIALGVGFFGGVVGAPGSFILAPLMMVVLKVPTRLTIGSTIAIVLITALSASVGKIATGQVPYLLAGVASIAAIPGAYLGSHLSHRMHAKALRYVLAVLISIVGVDMLIRSLN